MPTNASSPEAHPVLPRELVAFRRVLRAGVTAAVVLFLALALPAGPAAAHWSSSGTGSARASVATLLPPTNVAVPASSNSNVSISWNSPPGEVAPTGYYVTRLTGSTAFAACGSSPAAPISATTCTDTSVPEGTHRYQVIAVFRSWTAVSAVSGTVAVSSMRTLTFSSKPSPTVTAGSAITSFTVQLRTILGFEVWEPGVPITISIGANPAAGTLSGTVTAKTDWSGSATFNGLSINKAGAGYTLLASTPGYAGVLSSAFTVSPGAATKLVVTAGGTIAGAASASALIGPVTVERQDAFGNTVTLGSTSVSLSTSSPGSGIFAATAGGARIASVTIPAESSSASFFYGDTRAGAASITLSASGLAAPAPVTATITAAPAGRLLFGAIAPDLEKNKTIAPAVQVHVVDAFGNATGSSVPVTLASVCSIKGTLTVAASSGVATFVDLEIAGKASGCTLTATSGTLAAATSSSFNAY